MWEVTAKRDGITTRRFFKRLMEASTFADSLVENMYENVSVGIYRGQMPLFEYKFHKCS